jgi:hypothetical protein
LDTISVSKTDIPAEAAAEPSNQQVTISSVRRRRHDARLSCVADSSAVT